MRSDQMRIWRPAVSLASLALVLVVLGLALTTAPVLARGVAAQNDRQVVRFGEDILVGPGENVQDAVAFGGDITVNGTVRQSVVAFGGDITVAGTVRQSVVAFGGDVRLRPTAVVGRGMNADDSTVVSFGGTITSEPGARVTGKTTELSGENWNDAFGAIGSNWPAWFGWSPVGWLVQTAIFLVLALVAAALMPRQLLALQRRLGARPAASLGWGALTFFVIVPVTLVVLVVSVIGILLAVPLMVLVLLAYFFATTGVAALLAQKVLSGAGRQNLMLAVAIGVVGTTLVSRIPVAGALAVLAMTVFGVGAGVLAFVEWRRERKSAPVPAGPADGPSGGPGGPGGAHPLTPAPGAAAIEPPAPSPAESETTVQAPPDESVQTVQVAPDDMAPSVEAPTPPTPPTPPDASQLPTPSSHQAPPAQSHGDEA